LALAFPRPGWWWLALVGLAPLLLLAMAAPDGREAALRAWLGGTGFFLAVNAFLVPTVGPFMVPLAMLLAALWLPLGWLAWALLGGRRRPGPWRLAAAMALVPSAFVAGEAVRSWEGLGGPWGLLGSSQWNAPALLAVAALGGVWGLSFLLVAVNVAVAAAVGRGVPAATRVVAAAAAAVLPNVDAERAGAGGGIYKSALLVGPAGVLGSYDKLRLVPFGEYVPLRPLLGSVTRLTDAAAVDRHRGARLAVLDAGELAVGPLVCFESAFPDLARNLAADGADLVVVQTADTTFQGSWGLDQHASLSAVRAVESGRPVLQAAVSGTSAAFDARGRRLAWAPGSWRGAATVELPLSGERTPYVRAGDVVPAACGLALVAGAVVAARGRLSRGGSGRRTGSTPRSRPDRPRPGATGRSRTAGRPGS
jgi:apolipoprotein N-acyltransferase